MSVTPTQIPVSTSVPALTLAAGTTGGLAAAVSIDPVNDYSMIYTASATATQGINRNTYLGISSQPLGKTDTQTGISNKTFVAPVLGAATATSINGLAITSSTGTLTIANGKTLTASNTLTLAGTDSTTMTFPSSSDTVVTLAATQTLTNKTLTSPAIGTSILDTNANTLLALTATTPATGTLSLGRYSSSLPTLTTGQMNEPMLDSSSRLFVNVANSSLAVTGTFYQTTQPVSLATNTPTLQSGSTTAVTQATAANLNATVVGTGTFAVQSTNQANAGVNIGSVEVTDGTNTANVLPSSGTFTGQGALQVAPTYQEVGSLSAGSLNADLVASKDVSGYATWVLQVTGTWSGTLTFQGSNDNSNFVSVYGTWTGNTQPVSSMTSNGIMTGSVNFRYLRVRMTSYTSGTATGTLELKTMPFAQTNFMGIVTNSTGNQTTGTITTSSSSISLSSLQSYGSFVEVGISGTYAGVSFGITVSANSVTYNTPVYNASTGAWIQAGATITPGTNASVLYYVPVPLTNNGSIVKVLASAYSSGTANVQIGAYSYQSNPGSTLAQINDAAGNARGANVDGNNNLNVSLAGTGAMPALASGTNTIGGVNIVTSTSGGCSIATATALAGTATAVKTTAGQVYGAFIYNPNTTVAYVQFYNTTTGNTTVGTSALNPLAIPPGASASLDFPSQGVAFSTAITIACCTTATGSTGVSTGCVVNIYYA